MLPDIIRQKPRTSPNGDGEILRKIAGKVIASVLKENVIKCTGTLQVCDGKKACIEAAIHSMNMMYKDQNTDAILIVDASKALNSLNRQSFLHISHLSPSIVTYVKNCYWTLSRLLIVGGTEITSMEGTTQGDSVSIAIYGIGVTPLTNMLIAILSKECRANVNVVA